MSLWSALTAVAAVLLVTMGPGAVALAVAGLRGLALAALAPAVSLTVLAAGAALAGLLHVPWAWPAGLAATAVAAGVAVGVRRLLGRPDRLELPRRDGPSTALAWCAAAVAAPLAAVPMWAGMGGVRSVPLVPGADLQLGVLRLIHATGQGSPLTVLRPAGVGGAVARPSGWHDLVALAMSVTGTDATVAANVSALVLAALVVPLGTGYVSAALLPGRRWAAPLGMVAGTAFVSLPTLVVAGGIRWPYAWATGLLPAVLGALVLLLRSRSAAAVVVAVVALAGVASAQRLVVGSFALVAAPLVAAAALERWLRLNRDGLRRRALAEAGAAAGAGLVLAALVVLLTRHRPPAAEPIMTGAQAVGEALLDAPLSELPFGVAAPAWWLGALVIGGVLVAVRVRELRPWAVSWLVAVAMYALAGSAVGASPWRRVFTSWWLDDPIRLAALIPVVAAPLAVVAFDGLSRWLAARYPAPHQRRALLFGVLGLAVVSVLSLQRAGAREDRMRFDHTPPPAATAQPARP